MNYGELRTRVCQSLGIPTDDTSDEEYILVGNVLNEAVQDILARTRINVRCLHMRLLSGQSSYDIEDTVLRMMSLKVGTTYLTQAARTQLDQYSYCIPGHGLIEFGFSPSDDTMECEAWYVPRPTPMSDPTHSPNDPAFGNVDVQFHSAIINYTCWKVADLLDDASSQSGERYRVLYEGQDGMGNVGTNLGAIKKAVNRRAMTGPRQVTLPEREIFDSDPYLWVG